MSQTSDRRKAIKNILAGSAALAAGSAAMPVFAAAEKKAYMLKGNIQHSVCRWCFNGLTLDELCVAANDIGLKGIDLVPPKDWPTLKKYNLISTMCNGAEISLAKGWNDKQYHSTLIKNYTEHIDLVAAAGYKNLFTASGNRNGMDDETGLRNCVEGIKQILKIICATEHSGVLNCVKG
jgi:hydroxypyruvate isomerase